MSFISVIGVQTCYILKIKFFEKKTLGVFSGAIKERNHQKNLFEFHELMKIPRSGH